MKVLLTISVLVVSLFGVAPGAHALTIGSLETRAAAAGDIACASPLTGTGCLASKTADLIGDLQPNRVFALGDLVYDSGTYANFLSGYHPTWGQFKSKTLPVAGNHEYNDPGAAGYKQYWGVQATPAGKTWYSKRIGSWLILVLDSNCGSVGGCGSESAQGKWLKTQLSQAPRCTLALWHHPRVSSGPHSNNLAVAGLWSLLATNKVELMLSGHDHDYERFHTLGANGLPTDTIQSTREFVVGTGGKTFYPFATVKQGSRKRIANTEGVLSLGLHRYGYQWKFRNTNQVVLDGGQALCR